MGINLLRRFFCLRQRGSLELLLNPKLLIETIVEDELGQKDDVPHAQQRHEDQRPRREEDHDREVERLQQRRAQHGQVKFTTKPELIQLFDKETTNNLIWYDEVSSRANAPVSKSYNF